MHTTTYHIQHTNRRLRDEGLAAKGVVAAAVPLAGLPVLDFQVPAHAVDEVGDVAAGAQDIRPETGVLVWNYVRNR